MQHLLNRFGQQAIPCFFIIDFTKTHSYVYPLSQMPKDILWSMASRPTVEQTKKLTALQLKKKLSALTNTKLRLTKSLQKCMKAILIY